MLYYLPDSHDAVDWTYDLDAERRDPDRQTRNDLYCHEILKRPYDGILVSYAMVTAGRYSAPARRRLLRSGARAFFRAPAWTKFIGDPGAFSYVKDDLPPYTVDEVSAFYGALGLDYGMAVDHIVAGYSESGDLFGAPDLEAKRRYDLTLALASDFLVAAKPHEFEPVGVVQGWSPASYAESARHLQRMGYRYLALGGLVKLKTASLLRLLGAVDDVREPSTRLHLLGVTRPGNVAAYVARGVASIDSTSPLRRAWMDGRQNYWIGSESFAALRIPPSTSSRIRGRVESGELDWDVVRKLEGAAMEATAAYSASRHGTPKAALAALLDYQRAHSPADDREHDYRRTLDAKPWARCGCQICKRLGHHVILLRGAERNRSRGFHNVGQFYAGLQAELSVGIPPTSPR